MTHSDRYNDHIPVLMREAIHALNPMDGKVYVDGTFGVGGYSQEILEKAPSCALYVIDRDPDAIQRAEKMQDLFSNLKILPGNFGEMDVLMEKQNVKADGVVLDLGVSSPQLDQAVRGFSFQSEGPLDMRMEKKGMTAAEVINTYPEKEIANILWQYGEERKSRSIAKHIIQVREKKPIITTTQLTEIVHAVVPKNPKQKIDRATKTFQALRIYINKEMESLEQGLIAAEKILNPGGRLVIVSFHSLEDGKVKRFLQSRSGKKENSSRYAPICIESALAPTFYISEKRSISPTKAEVMHNPRARSAKLRWAIRTHANPWPVDTRGAICM